MFHSHSFVWGQTSPKCLFYLWWLSLSYSGARTSLLCSSSHVTRVCWLDMLPLETFWGHLLLLIMATLVIIDISLKSFGAIWLLSFVVSLRHKASTCIITASCAWSHWHSRANPTSRGVVCSCSHSNSWWRFELLDWLSISHAHILLLVSATHCLILTSLVLLLLIHISAWMKSTSRSLVVTCITWSISCWSCALTTFLLRI
jgi:hypothetical protein